MSDEDGNRDPVSYPGSGRHVVQTLSGSIYFIDLDLMQLQRAPATRNDDRYHVGIPFSVAMRRDNRLVKILRLHVLVVGCPAVFDLEPLGDAHLVAFTRRRTTEVVSIDPFERWLASAQAEGS